MNRRLERQRQQQREALSRILDLLETQGWESLEPSTAPHPLSHSVRDRHGGRESIFFFDQADLIEGLVQMLSQGTAHDALQAFGLHLEEDRALWLRRLLASQSHPQLMLRQMEFMKEIRQAFASHFRRWGAAHISGQRSAELEAWAVVGALEGALEMWVEGNGRPALPVLLADAMALLWPALYSHQRRT